MTSYGVGLSKITSGFPTTRPIDLSSSVKCHSAQAPIVPSEGSARFKRGDE